jgi:excinuclease ABC subunit C
MAAARAVGDPQAARGGPTVRDPLAVRSTCELLPERPGVYRFRDLRGVSMYVGRATNLRRRTISYWGSLKGRAHLRRMVPQIGAVEAIECASVHEAAWLERNILERGLLRWNRARGGLEVPVWLVLDPAPRSPSLRLTHAPATEGITIGPYLGADRARLIRSGILRVWPIAATGTGLSGSERDMAATRGVGPEDRDSYAAAIQAALAGRAAEVGQWRAGLAAARDRASAGLAFELAGQVTSEMDAIGWATGVQRVTTLERIDADIHGWSGGVLVSLQIRAGRMERWRQALVDGEPRRKVEQTPEEWRGFAAANAQLAASLLGR